MHSQAIFKVPNKQLYLHLMKIEGCDEQLLFDLLKLKVIKDYENLYLQYEKILPSFRDDITDVWQLLILSGEKAAFDFAIQNGVKANTADNRQENVLHFAALSGVPERFHDAIKLGVPFHSESFDKLNVLHFAMLSQKKEMVETILEHEKNFALPLNRDAKKGRSVLHISALTGNVKVIELALNLVGVAKINEKDIHDYTALNYVIKSDNQQARKFLEDNGAIVGTFTLDPTSFAGIRYMSEMGIDPKTQLHPIEIETPQEKFTFGDSTKDERAAAALSWVTPAAAK